MRENHLVTTGSYRNLHDRYLALLPAELRPAVPPRRESTWWPWRDMTVHVERVGEPDAPGRAILLHGAGGHAAALWPYAALVARQGYHVVVPDLPGYGRTRVPHRAAVRYPDWVALAGDLLLAERRSWSGPLLLIGASVGGMLAYDIASRTGGADRVVVTCLLDPRDPATHRHIAPQPWLGAVAHPLLRAAAGPLAGLSVPLRWLTRMRAIGNRSDLVELVLRDRFGGGNAMPLGFLRSYLDSAPAVEPEQATGFELVLAHPTEDRWTPIALSLRFFDRVGTAKRLVRLTGAGHYPVEAAGVRQLVRAIAADGPGPAR